MNFISEEKLQEIINRIDILTIISSYTKLKKSGASYKGLCMFHKEKTPSFTVNAQKGLWKCFGCGEGGNLFTFYMKIENISFQEAVRRLANTAGVTIEDYTSTNREFKSGEQLYLANEFALNYFKQILYNTREGKDFNNYLLKRAFTDEEIKSFSFGATLPCWDGLLSHIKIHNKDIKEFLKVGLLIEKEGKLYDRFRDRLIVPIYDENSKLVAFAGRTLKEETPKYINSPESKIFQKNNILYGLNITKNHIKESGYSIIVEGYFDVISLFKQGIKNVVASMGTSLTENQINTISRFCDKVIISYDSDIGGRSATLRGIDLLLNAGLEVMILKLPDGYDPDNFIKEKGKRDYENLLLNTIPFMDYYIETTIAKEGGINSISKKNKCVNAIIERLDLLLNPIVFDETVKKIAKRLEVNEGIIRALYNTKKNSSHKKYNSVPENQSEGKYILVDSIKSTNLEKELLKCLLQDLLLIEKIIDLIEIDDFQNEKYKELYKYILDLYKDKKENINFDFFKYNYIPDNLSLIISELTVNKDVDEKIENKVFEEIIVNLIKLRKKRKISCLKKDLKSADEEKLKQILTEFSRVKKEIIKSKECNS